MRQFLTDERLLGSRFADPSFLPWRVLLIAAWGEALVSDQERAVYRALTNRETTPTRRCDEIVLCIGRKGGKSHFMAAVAVFIAAMCDHPSLVRGERGVVLLVAQNASVAAIVLNFAAAFFDASPALQKLLVHRTQDTLVLRSGVSIEVRTASFRGLRGPSYLACLADEVAFWYGEDGSSNPDTEIIAAIAPALGLHGGPLIIASSPYARRGVLYQRFTKLFGKDIGNALAARGSTRDLNAKFPQAVVDAALAEDPAKNSAEYLGMFRTDVESFVGREVVDAAVVPGRYELPRIAGTSYTAFVDPSGGSADAMTLAICHREGDRAVVDAVRERRPPFSPEAVVGEFSVLLKSYGVSAVRGDRYGGEWPRERFNTHGIRYVVADKAKSDIYRDLLPIFGLSHSLNRRLNVLEPSAWSSEPSQQ
jgi:hypothetical protein